MPIFQQDFVVFVDKLASLQMLLMHHGPWDFLAVFVESIGVYSLEPIIQVFLKNVSPGDRPQYNMPVRDGIPPWKVYLITIPLVALLAVLEIAIQQLVFLMDVTPILLNGCIELFKTSCTQIA